ncbi:uncharacterized protein [Haliotis cracherodii]|uniref:uncharacterized protein n=1 Tax=Haliotis cracherodii TaxID=6455 RepID=UPI0039EAB690
MTSEFVQNLENRMNFYKHMQDRRRRKLPYVQRHRSQQLHSFWPTFRGALAWMRKNQETLNTAISLLDIYPSLIQDSCMDVFWEFLKPYVVSDDTKKIKKVPLDKTDDRKSRRGQSTAKVKPPPIPIISVTNDLDDDIDDVIKDSDFNQRKTKLYISGQSQSDVLMSPFSKLTSELKEEYSIQAKVPSNYSAHKLCQSLSDCEIFLFLMSQESVFNPSSYRDLSAAWTMDIPTVFVKPPGFKLPSPLPDSVILYTFENQIKSNRRRCADKFSHSVTPSLGSNLRPDQRQASALPSLRPLSAQEVSSYRKHPLVHRDSCDIVLMLINGYRNATVWDPINQDQSLNDIKRKIEKNIYKMDTPVPSPTPDVTSAGMFVVGEETRKHDLKHNAGNLLAVPNYNIHSPLNISLDDLSVDHDIQTPISPSPLYQSLSDPEEVTSPVEKETFYVVFKDSHSPGNVVKWPPTDDQVMVDDVFADSPLSFKDVDLTLDMRNELETSDCDSSAGAL